MASMAGFQSRFPFIYTKIAFIASALSLPKLHICRDQTSGMVNKCLPMAAVGRFQSNILELVLETLKNFTFGAA